MTGRQDNRGGFSRPTKEINDQIAAKGYSVKWSDKNQEPYYTYTAESGASREVWFENADTLKTKLDLVKKYQLAGIAIWRLGFEDQKFWDEIAGTWGKKMRSLPPASRPSSGHPDLGPAPTECGELPWPCTPHSFRPGVSPDAEEECGVHDY